MFNPINFKILTVQFTYHLDDNGVLSLRCGDKLLWAIKTKDVIDANQLTAKYFGMVQKHLGDLVEGV